jgi:hypothetical protein
MRRTLRVLRSNCLRVTIMLSIAAFAVVALLWIRGGDAFHAVIGRRCFRMAFVESTVRITIAGNWPDAAHARRACELLRLGRQEVSSWDNAGVYRLCMDILDAAEKLDYVRRTRDRPPLDYFGRTRDRSPPFAWHEAELEQEIRNSRRLLDDLNNTLVIRSFPTIRQQGPLWIESGSCKMLVRVDPELWAFEPVVPIQTLVLPTSAIASAFALVPGGWVIVGFRRWGIARHRVRSQRCRECGYDLRATPGRCPECGAVPAAQPARPGGAGG